MTRLLKDFYLQSAVTLAPLLLGKFLCTAIDGEIRTYRITETEAYFGEEDSACHAHKGKTKRTQTLYEQGGIAYVYLCYGIHSLLNVVTGAQDHPEAVLIRGVEGFNGPGKLTKALHIDRSFNEENLCTSSLLWIADDGYLPAYTSAPRVGINYAEEEYRNMPWRFITTAL